FAGVHVLRDRAGHRTIRVVEGQIERRWRGAGVLEHEHAAPARETAYVKARHEIGAAVQRAEHGRDAIGGVANDLAHRGDRLIARDLHGASPAGRDGDVGNLYRSSPVGGDRLRDHHRAVLATGPQEGDGDVGRRVTRVLDVDRAIELEDLTGLGG